MGVYLEGASFSYTPSPLNVARAQYERKQDAGNIFEGDQEIADAKQMIEDAQLALTDRLDLLEGVEAYAHAYMSRNRNAEWSVGNWRDLPFDAALGPARGALVDASLGGIVLGSEGLWTLYVRATARATGFQGGGGVRMDVSVHNPDGSIRTQHVIEGTSLRGTGIASERYGAVTLQATFPVVVDIPGCYVTVRCFAEAWRWWDGGTRWSSMSALKHSSSPENPGQDTVPDETAPPEPDPPVTPDP